MHNTFEHVLLKLMLLIVTRKGRKSRGCIKTNSTNLHGLVFEKEEESTSDCKTKINIITVKTCI